MFQVTAGVSVKSRHGRWRRVKHTARLNGSFDDRDATGSRIEDFFARLHRNDGAQEKHNAGETTETREG
jgi:hypothetical protein